MTASSSIAFASAGEFIASVLRLRPRLAVFDCDGTLWSLDSGEAFFYWELERGLVPPDLDQWARRRYHEYRAGRVSEEQMCGEMVTLHRGIACELLERAARQFFSEQVASAIFPDMLTLTDKLSASGCELWAVSSTNDWVVRAGAERFGIPGERVLATCVQVLDGVATDRLVRVPSGPGKAAAVREVIGRAPDVAFGNSIYDLELLEAARHPFVINPNRELEELALQRGWPVYWPESTGHGRVQPKAGLSGG